MEDEVTMRPREEPEALTPTSTMRVGSSDLEWGVTLTDSPGNSVPGRSVEGNRARVRGETPIDAEDGEGPAGRRSKRRSDTMSAGGFVFDRSTDDGGVDVLQRHMRMSAALDRTAGGVTPSTSKTRGRSNSMGGAMLSTDLLSSVTRRRHSIREARRSDPSANPTDDLKANGAMVSSWVLRRHTVGRSSINSDTIGVAVSVDSSGV
jgi:hypothetical protein